MTPPDARRDCCPAALRLQSADGPADRPKPPPRHAHPGHPGHAAAARSLSLARHGRACRWCSPRAHSGRNYPADFVAAARLDALTLRRSEDGFVDELFAAAPAYGAPLLAATFPRAFCDANREPWELDPGMFEERLPPWVNTASARVGAGLGTIARIVASGEAIYRRKLRFAEAERRVRLYWEPFHTALRDLVAATRQQFGACLLVDCHSMPGEQPHHASRRPISCWATHTARPAPGR